MVGRVFAVKPFHRFAKDEGLADADLLLAISNAEAGKGESDLGGGLHKVRVAPRGSGKSGGYRTLVAIKSSERSVFLHGFAKSDLDNIGKGYLALLKTTAKEVLARTDEQVKELLESGAWREIARPIATPQRQDNGDEKVQDDDADEL